jgi:hypothetical protein
MQDQGIVLHSNSASGLLTENFALVSAIVIVLALVVVLGFAFRERGRRVRPDLDLLRNDEAGWSTPLVPLLHPPRGGLLHPMHNDPLNMSHVFAHPADHNSSMETPFNC